MVKKNNTPLSPWLLFLISAILLSAGWLMKSFPVCIFLGVAPLFAIADQAKENDDFWVNTEFILLALFTSFFAASAFDSHHLIASVVQSIIFTLAFLAYSFSYQNLGSRLGKFTIIFFWLGIEYILLKLPWLRKSIFLADATQLISKWTKWNEYSGYLGSTLWILVTNLLLYKAVFNGKINRRFLGLTLICLAAPCIYSYFVNQHGINREQMISLYSGHQVESLAYGKQGELVARTSAWISVLIVVVAIVKKSNKEN
jgi:hypothetical protein